MIHSPTVQRYSVQGLFWSLLVVSIDAVPRISTTPNINTDTQSVFPNGHSGRNNQLVGFLQLNWS